jgi:hypothetical protein
MADFGTPETWNMKVGQFIEEKEFILPQKKPQEIVEQRRKERLSNFLKDYPGAVEPETRTFIESIINRQNFSTAGVVKTLLKKIPPYQGAEKIGESTKKQRDPEKNFMKAFLEYADKKFEGNFAAAARSIGESREKIKGIFDRVRLSETGKRAGADVGKGSQVRTTIPTPKNLIPYSEATTKVKADQKFLKNKIKNYDKNKFYNARDLGNILGFDFAGKKDIYDKFTADLKRFGVAKKQFTEKGLGQKKYKLGDVVNKLTEGYKKKLVKGQRVAQSERAEIDAKLDPELKQFLGNFRNTTRSISKEEDIFVPNAIEDVGHPLSVKITDKYPKLTKNSNINKINTLTFQDPIVNQNILEATGYESNHDILLKRLNKLVGKKIGPKELEELQEIKSTMNDLHSKAVDDVANLSKEGTSLYNPRTKKTTTYQGEYFKGQKNRIPKIDINIPKQGQTFKSEDLFVDMSNVNPAFRVGLVDQINPNAKFFKDLTKEQKEIYKRNVLDQTKFNLEKFYTKAGFPKEQIDELKDSLEFGTSSKLGIATTGVLGLGSTAAAADEPGVKKDDSILPEAAVGTAAVAPLATKKGRSIYGTAGKGLLKALQTIGTPFGVVAGETLLPGGVRSQLQEEGLEKTLRNPLSYAGLPLASIGAEAVKNPALQRILNLGLPLKVIRAGTPVGLGLMGISALVDSALKFQEEFDALSPEEQKAYLEEQEKFGEDIQGAAEGGIMRLGLAEGPDKKGLKSPGRRKFMKDTGKLAGILALIPYLGKFIAPVAKSPAAVEGIKLGADKLIMLVDKIKKFGVDKTKSRATQDLQEVTIYQGKDGSEYELVEDLATGDIRVTKEKPGMGSYGDETFDTIEDRSVFEIKKGRGDETTKGTPPDEYDEGKEIFGPEGTVDDVDEIDDRIIKEIDDEIN